MELLTQKSTCHVLSGYYGLLMQLLLMFVFLGTLAYKYMTELLTRVTERSPQEFLLDCTKQLLGAFWIHGLNLVTAWKLGQNECEVYFISIMIDCTLGVFAEFHFLRFVTWLLKRTLCHGNQSVISTGQYYEGEQFQWGRFVKQTAVWFMVVTMMKISMLIAMFILSMPLMSVTHNVILAPFAVWPRLELLVVMVLVPACMNAFQFWCQDNFLQKQENKAHPRTGKSDPCFCVPQDSPLRRYLSPLLGSGTSSGKGSGKGPGKGSGKGSHKGSAPGKGPGKGKVVSSLGPRPDGLKAKNTLKWKKIGRPPSEDNIFSEPINGSVFDSIYQRSISDKDKLKDVPPEFLNTFMQVDTPTENSEELIAQRAESPIRQNRRSSGAPIERAACGPTVFRMDLYHKQLERKKEDKQSLSAVLGRREPSEEGWPQKAPDDDLLENILLKFFEAAEPHVSQITSFSGTLQPSEQFLKELVEYSGDLKILTMRVHAFLSIDDLKPGMKRVEDRLSRVHNAVETISTSRTLPIVLRDLLQLGNYVNHGSALGNAFAIDISSLSDLGVSRCQSRRDPNKKVSVLQFLAELIDEMHGSRFVADFKEDLLRCVLASKEDLVILGEQVTKITQAMQSLTHFAATVKEGNPPCLSPEIVEVFLNETQDHLQKVEERMCELKKGRSHLLQYFGLRDIPETTIPVILGYLATFYEQMFREQVLPESDFESSDVRVDPLQPLQVWLDANGFAGVNESRTNWAGAGHLYPLHMAVNQVKPDMVRLLLQQGANHNLKHLGPTARQWTPLQLAHWNFPKAHPNADPPSKQDEILKLLEDCEGEVGDDDLEECVE